MALMMVLALVVLALVGCGGPPREVRVALAETAGGLVLADELVADAVRDRGEEMRAQVRQERRDGMIAGETVEDIVSASLARFEELMGPTTMARTAIGTAGPSLRALEGAVDAWDAGTGDASSFAQAAACAGVALSEVVTALLAADLELPDLLRTGAALLRGFAAAICSEGD